MLVITGLGRCGMSLVGQVLMSMNYRGGNDLNNYLLPSIHELNKDIYNQIITRGSVDIDSICKTEYWKGKTYKYAMLNCIKDKRQGPIHFVIDPCFMWHTDILRAWVKSERVLKFLILHRDFNDIIDSYRKNLPYDDEVYLGADVNRYEKLFSDFTKTIKELNIPHHIGMYDNIIKESSPMFGKVRKISHLQFCHRQASVIMKEILNC